MSWVAHAFAAMFLAILVRKGPAKRWVERGAFPWACDFCMGAWAALMLLPAILPCSIEALAERWGSAGGLAAILAAAWTRLQGPTTPPELPG